MPTPFTQLNCIRGKVKGNLAPMNGQFARISGSAETARSLTSGSTD